uniref:Putative serine protease n=1 Tax=Kellev virus TaxID=2800921 RepID=A0A894KNN3_9VIRU|nr:MAG: putative serine protease [Kellev virus]QRW41865.1 MAG: putative serine protease [Kellev virus]
MIMQMSESIIEFWEDYLLPLQLVGLLTLAIFVNNVMHPLNKTMAVISFFSLLGLMIRAIFLTMGNVIGNAYIGARTFVLSGVRYTSWAVMEAGANWLIVIMAVILNACLLYYIYKLVTEPKIKYIVPEVVREEFVPERAMPNSTFECIKTLPSFQAMVMASLDGITYHVMGQCFWVDEGLVTAAHVIEGFEDICIFRDEQHRFHTSSDIFEVGHGDYAVCRDPILITQKLGLSKAKFSRLAVQKDAGLSVNIVALGKRSVGVLDQHRQFGFVQYSGSTVKGFSGAPHHFGKTIFGMHLGSDSKNIGYDGAFLKSELKPSRVIKNQLGIQTEDSAEWLAGQLERYEEVEYFRSPYNPDEYKIRVGGMYHIVDEEVLDMVLTRRNAKKSEPDRLEYLDEAASMVGSPTQVKPEPEMERVEPVFVAPEPASISVSVSTQTDNCVEGKPLKETPLHVKAVNKPNPPRESLHIEEDPLIAMVKGMLTEWGKSSLMVKQPETSYTKESRDVEDLPLAPRNAMSFDDSGNLLRAPSVNVGARGMEYQKENARSQGLQTCQPMDYTCRPPSETYHMESRTLTHAPQKEASTRTVRNKNRRMRRQQLKRELEQYRQHCGPIQFGDVTLPPPLIPTIGLTENSIRH